MTLLTRPTLLPLIPLRQLLLPLLLAGLVGSWPLAAAADSVIRIDGSSTVYPISEAVAEEFHSHHGDINVEVVVSGTGGGLAKFCRGEIDIANASRPISKKEMAACRAAGIQYLELPVGYDALTVVVNKNNSFISRLTPAQLKQIWEPASQGKIMRWNQLDPSFPNTPLRLYGPGNNSGTFDYFTEAIVGKAKQSRTDYIASEDDYLIVRGVSRNEAALGYFGYAYYLANQRKLKAVAIDNGQGPVLPSPESVENGSYAPLSRPIFIYLAAPAQARAEVRQFIDYYMAHAARIVRLQNYVPLSADVYQLNRVALEQHRFGTVYGGTEATGMRIEDMLKRQPQS
jgi:phosphate transport system substrate-binding protein